MKVAFSRGVVIEVSSAAGKTAIVFYTNNVRKITDVIVNQSIVCMFSNAVGEKI